MSGIPIKEYKINEQIRSREVFLIDERGEQIGVRPTNQAIELSMDRGYDLVEVAPQANPPVCRMMDYGQFRYSQSKKEREARRGSKAVELREVRMRVKIGQHDKDFKVRTARKLLAGGDKVKVSVVFRAREITHPEVGEELLAWFFEQLEDVAEQERKAGMEGRFMTMTLEPIRKAPSKKAEPVG